MTGLYAPVLNDSEAGFEGLVNFLFASGKPIFPLCRISLSRNEKGEEQKKFMFTRKAWQKPRNAPSAEEVIAWREDREPSLKGKAVKAAAVIPASVGYLVFDLDEGGEKPADQLVKHFRNQGIYAFRVPSRRETDKGGWHIWVRMDAEQEEIANRNFVFNARGGIQGKGETRHGKGGCLVVWNPEGIMRGLLAEEDFTSKRGAFLADIRPFLKETTSEKAAGDPPEDMKRHDTLKYALTRAAAAGDDLAFSSAERKARADGLPEKEIADLVTWARRAIPKPFNVFNHKTLARAFAAEGIDWRFNNRGDGGGRMEYRYNCGKWKKFDEAWEARVRFHLEEKYSLPNGVSSTGAVKTKPFKGSFRDWQDAVRILFAEKEHDPFIEYLETRPAWDEDVRLHLLLSELFEVPADDLIAQWGSVFLFVAPIERAYNPGVKQRTVPGLLGPQECGKSDMLRYMFREEHQQDFFGDDVAFDEKGSNARKDRIEQTVGKVLVEISEFNASRRDVNMNEVKRFISGTQDTYRIPYDRRPGTRARRFAKVITTNNPRSLPHDPSGNTRFAMIELLKDKAKPIEFFEGETSKGSGKNMRDQLWAEALHIYRERAAKNPLISVVDFPEELRKERNLRAEEHTRLDYVIEDAIDNLSDPAAGISVEELAAEIDRKPWQIYPSLDRRKWRPKRANREGKRVRLWFPPGNKALF